jgi:hypothetical protein
MKLSNIYDLFESYTPDIMDKLNWIGSTGGPLILISDKSYGLWSGILKRDSYLNNKIEEADDFLNADEADYGKACSIQGYLGVVNIGDDTALILGDEPLLTTVIYSTDKMVIIARWYYGENDELVDNYLNTIDLNSIDNWELSLTFKLNSDRQYLFDSACSETMINKKANGFLHLDIKQGEHKIWTTIYEPDSTTRLIIHKLETTI